MRRLAGLIQPLSCASNRSLASVYRRQSFTKSYLAAVSSQGGLTGVVQSRWGFGLSSRFQSGQFRLPLASGQKRWSGSKNSPEKTENSEKKPRLLSKLPVPVHENIYTVPNLLTFSRLLAAPAVGYLLVHHHHAAALSLFAYAGITDLIDGYIARRYNLQTVVGTIIDPAADKLLMTISVVCLALNGSMPMWLAALILGRDIGLSMMAIYYRWVSLPPPKTMARYWDFSLPSAEVKPTTVSKANTALQLLLVGMSMALPVVPAWLAGAWGLHDGMIGLQVWKTGLPVRSAVLKPHAGWLVVGWVTTSESQLLYLVAGTTVWSGMHYLFSRDSVKILSKTDLDKLKSKHR